MPWTTKSGIASLCHQNPCRQCYLSALICYCLHNLHFKGETAPYTQSSHGRSDFNFNWITPGSSFYCYMISFTDLIRSKTVLAKSNAHCLVWFPFPLTVIPSNYFVASSISFHFSCPCMSMYHRVTGNFEVSILSTSLIISLQRKC